MSNTVETVKRIVSEISQSIPGAQVIAPLHVWDGDGSMGVQIKAPQMRGFQQCEGTANFVLNRVEITNERMIRAKATIAFCAIVNDVQVQIRPLEKLKPVSELELRESATERAV